MVTPNTHSRGTSGEAFGRDLGFFLFQTTLDITETNATSIARRDFLIDCICHLTQPIVIDGPTAEGHIDTLQSYLSMTENVSSVVVIVEHQGELTLSNLAGLLNGHHDFDTDGTNDNSGTNNVLMVSGSKATDFVRAVVNGI